MGSQKVEDDLATEEQQFFFITLFTLLKKLLYTYRLIWSDIFILNLPPELQNHRSNCLSPQVPQSSMAPPLNQYPILEVTPWAFPILVNAKLVHLDIQIRDSIVIPEASHKLSFFFFFILSTEFLTQLLLLFTSSDLAFLMYLHFSFRLLPW